MCCCPRYLSELLNAVKQAANAEKADPPDVRHRDSGAHVAALLNQHNIFILSLPRPRLFQGSAFAYLDTFHAYHNQITPARQEKGQVLTARDGHKCERVRSPLQPRSRYVFNTHTSSINVNDPGLITLVNKLQDVFTTVGVCCIYTPFRRPQPDI